MSTKIRLNFYYYPLFLYIFYICMPHSDNLTSLADRETPSSIGSGCFTHNGSAYGTQ